MAGRVANASFEELKAEAATLSADARRKLVAALVEQAPPFWQGIEAQLSAVESQTSPFQPSVQVHLKASGSTLCLSVLESSQVPSFWHGWLAHSSVSVSQLSPSKPSSHVHV